MSTHVLRWSSRHLPIILLSRNISMTRNVPFEQCALQRLGDVNSCRKLSLTALSCGPKKYRKKKAEPIVLQKKTSKQFIEVYDDVTLKELAFALKEDIDTISNYIIGLDELNLKYVDNVNMPLDQKLALLIMDCYDVRPRYMKRPSSILSNTNQVVEDVFPQTPPPAEELVRRAPVVTIMGHVDHGKTTLLDALRNSRIAAQEFGGITQHIGAFSVTLPKTGDMVTFIDTPGHAAFKAMRERGARATDIVVLVVAADDGVKDQTIESIKYASEAGVPLVVAINKCDKFGVDPQQIKHQLLEHSVVSEDLGGDVQVVEISALQSKNLDKLQEALVTQAEVMNLKSTPKGLVEGVVIESTTIQGLGKVCTMIVNRGTLRKHSTILAGTSWGCVRTMHNEFNKAISEAGPSCPVRVSGWNDELPQPGEIVFEMKDEKHAKLVSELRAKKKKEAELVDVYKKIDEEWDEQRKKYEEIRQEKLRRGIRYNSAIRRVVDTANQYVKQPDRDPDAPPEVKLILRCDVDGTLEAILNVLDTYDSEMAKLDLVDFGVGPPAENTVELAREFNSLIYCFNVPISPKVQTLAINNNVELKTFRVIYHLVNQLKEDLSAVLPPIIDEKILAEGHVIRQFLIPAGIQKSQPIAGTYVDWGTFERKGTYRFFRKDRLLYDGTIESLKCDKEFVASAGSNTEVGIAVPSKDVRFKEGDRVEQYEKVVTPQFIDWSPPGF